MIRRPLSELGARAPQQVGSKGKARTAFVLSGGGSLGAVQVGMLRALFENNVHPDLLVGTSVGAVNAAWIAGRPSVDGAHDLADIWLSLRRQDVFPLSPMTGFAGLLGRSNHFISNSSLRAVLERHLLFERLEDPALSLHVVATELKSGRAAILSSGAAVPALLASCAIPGVFPPVTIGKRDYVDGGVANHTPITVALELGASRIFVLPVGYPWLNREPTNALGMALHALARIVEQKLDADVASYRNVAEIRLMPSLDLADVSPADFSHTRDLIEWGYKSALRELIAAPSSRRAQTTLAERVKRPLRLAQRAA
jgi:NTE family protein